MIVRKTWYGVGVPGKGREGLPRRSPPTTALIGILELGTRENGVVAKSTACPLLTAQRQQQYDPFSIDNLASGGSKAKQGKTKQSRILADVVVEETTIIHRFVLIILC
jgi:hypothetical protein